MRTRPGGLSMMRLVPGSWACLCLCLCACASAPRSPFFGDDRFLVVGVEPEAEARQLEAQFAAAGYRLDHRFHGRHFHALGFRDSLGRRAFVRILTPRGIMTVLDADPGDRFHPALRYRLLQAPLPDTHDADGDGFEEVFVERVSERPSERCLLVFRVRDSGFVDPVAVPEGYAVGGADPRLDPAWQAPSYCEAPAAATDTAAVDSDPSAAPSAGDAPKEKPRAAAAGQEKRATSAGDAPKEKRGGASAGQTQRDAASAAPTGPSPAQAPNPADTPDAATGAQPAE